MATVLQTTCRGVIAGRGRSWRARHAGVGRLRYVPAMVIYMLSKGNSGWVLYDDEGRIAELPADRDAMLEAATVMRRNGDPVAGWWSAVLDAKVPTFRFTPKL